MTLNFHWHKLTDSQKKSVVGFITGILSLIAGNAPGIVSELHEWGLPPKVLHALSVGIGAIAYYYTIKGRSLDTSNSGTGTGLIDRGPDVWAKQAQGGANSAAGVSTPETGQSPGETLSDVNTSASAGSGD